MPLVSARFRMRRRPLPPASGEFDTPEDQIRERLRGRLAALEEEAGVRALVDEVRARPDFGLFGVDMARQRVRRAYFSVAHPDARMRLIHLASELERRELFDLARDVRAARLAHERARRVAGRPVWPLAALVGLLVVVAGSFVPGLDADLVAAPLGVVAAMATARQRRGSMREAERSTAEALAHAESAARRRASLPRLFDPAEVITGAERVDFGRLTALSAMAADAMVCAPAPAERSAADRPPSPSRT